MNSTRVLGTRIDRVNLDDTLRIIKTSIEKNTKLHICTTNNEFILEAQKNNEFRHTINNCDLSIPDSTGVVWAGKFLNNVKLNKVPGVDLFGHICKLAAENDFRIFLLGGSKDVGKKTKDSLQKRYRGIHVVGYVDGVSIDPNNEDLDLVSEINSSKAQILAVALGAPKQELWIKKNEALLNANIYIGVGGTFDYISGVVKRAPTWMRKIGLEWAYRLFIQPSRLCRIYKALVIFPAKVIVEKLNKS